MNSPKFKDPTIGRLGPYKPMNMNRINKFKENNSKSPISRLDSYVDANYKSTTEA